ncbi:MAG: hypothetical protein NC392_03285, partial [Roseburia sp.]|nr:hypothetical protein [Roseburia sp.]
EETVQMLIEVQAAGQDTQELWNLAVAQGKITDGTIATESNVDALLAAAQAIIEQAKQDIIDTMSGFKLDFDFRPAISSAKSAGKDTGDAYKEGLEEALSDIESVISGVTNAINDQIDAIGNQKDAAIDAIDQQIDVLEEERDARLAIIEAQKEQLENEIKAIESNYIS